MCQHNSFASEDVPSPVEAADSPEHAPQVWFQPVVDTFGHRILGHQCLPWISKAQDGFGGEAVHAARIRSAAIRAAAEQSRAGLYFLDLPLASVDDPALDMSSTLEALFGAGLRPRNLVFEMAESDVARNPAHARIVRAYLRQRGFGFALAHAGLGSGGDPSEMIHDLQPEFIRLDPRLIRYFDQLECAPTISRVARLAEATSARLVAAGVDRMRMVENLWLLGVGIMQGRVFGDPRLSISPDARTGPDSRPALT